MNNIEYAAFLSVGRACGFAGLAVLCIILGLSYQPVVAANTGGILALIVSLYLSVCALRAPRRPYHLTETWIILPAADRPPKSVAQLVVGRALREAYSWFAKYAAGVSVVLFAMSIVFYAFENFAG